jgi:hypothetical protein
MGGLCLSLWSDIAKLSSRGKRGTGTSLRIDIFGHYNLYNRDGRRYLFLYLVQIVECIYVMGISTCRSLLLVCPFYSIVSYSYRHHVRSRSSSFS